MQTARTIARHLLRLEAVKLRPKDPFEWASGWKSPIYCDNRLTLSDPAVRTEIRDALVSTIRAHFPEAGGIAGVATAGIPQAALIADQLELPLIYVRGKAKSHGRQNQIEGKLESGQNWVVIEDLISTGGSSIAAVEALRQAGGKVLGLAAIFTYGFPAAAQNFRAANLPWKALSQYDILLEEAVSQGYVSQDVLGTLSAWQKDPQNWG